MKNLKRLIFAILIILIFTFLLNYRVLGYYTDSINKGDSLKFIGNSWYVYNSENAAKNLDKSAIKKTINKNTVFVVYAKNGNVLKISNSSNEYIYYGSSGSKNFTKISTTTNNSTKNNTVNNTANNTNKLSNNGLISSFLSLITKGTEATIKIGSGIFAGLFNRIANSSTLDTLVNKASNSQTVDNIDKVEIIKEIDDSSIFSNQSSKNKLWAYRSSVTNKGSHQYALLNGLKYQNIDYSGRVSVDKETNIVMIDNKYYCTALGTYFGKVGDKFIVKLDTGKSIYAIMCDAKGNDSKYFKDNKTLAHDYNGTKSFLEFYCDGKAKKEGSSYVYQTKFQGRVTSIIKIQ